MRAVPTVRVLGFVVAGAVVAIWRWTAPSANPPVSRPEDTAAGAAETRLSGTVPVAATDFDPTISDPPSRGVARPMDETPVVTEVPVAPPAPRNDPATRTSRLTRFPVPLRDIAANAPKDLSTLRVPLPLRAGENFEMQVRSIERQGDNAGTFIGEVAGRPGTLVILSYTGLAQAGTVQLPAESTSFRIRGIEDGTVRVDEVDLTQAPECAVCIAAQNNGTASAHPTH